MVWLLAEIYIALLLEDVKLRQLFWAASPSFMAWEQVTAQGHFSIKIIKNTWNMCLIILNTSSINFTSWWNISLKSSYWFTGQYLCHHWWVQCWTAELHEYQGMQKEWRTDPQILGPQKRRMGRKKTRPWWEGAAGPPWGPCLPEVLYSPDD